MKELYNKKRSYRTAPKDTGKMGLGKAIIPFAFEVRRIYWLMYVCIYEYMSISRHITMRLIYNIYDKSHILYIYMFVYVCVSLSFSHPHTGTQTHIFISQPQSFRSF